MSLKKIGEMVGVSPSTVSRVLTIPNYKCSSETLRNQIFEAAKQLNYTPNQSARNLKLGKSEEKVKRIGILVTKGDDTDPFLREILNIIERQIHAQSCILSQIYYSDALNQTIADSDGMIVLGRCYPDVIKKLEKQTKNIINITRNTVDNGVDSVVCDGKKIAKKAVEYLIKLGHRKIAYIGNCHKEERFLGYQQTLFHYNIETKMEYIFDISQNEEQGYKVMKKIMKMKDSPTGIYCSNDVIAVGVLKFLNKYKSRYYHPSVISSDDIYEAQFTTPMLTTVALPKEEMARNALLFLLDRIEGGHKSVAKIELESNLIVRSSCSQVNNTTECDYYI